MAFKFLGQRQLGKLPSRWVSTILMVAIIFLLAEYMIASGGGDFLIVLKGMLHRTDKKKSVYCDHPYECGFVVFEK